MSRGKHLLAASLLFLREIEDCIAARQDFAFETTLAGRSYLKLIERFSKKSLYALSATPIF
jgi:predicted ABC-type ATPase